jgi:hypothetical protein
MLRLIACLMGGLLASAWMQSCLLMRLLVPCPHSGLPNNDQKWFCPANGTSCYWYNSTNAAYSDHRNACKGLGGYLVAFNTGELGRV